MMPTPWMMALIVSVQPGLLLAQQPIPLQRPTQNGGMPPSGGYKPPALSLTELFETDPVLNRSLLSFLQTGDKHASRTAVMNAAQAGNVGAALLLGEQYIPEQCVSEPNQDAPHCGKNGNEAPRVVSRKNPLGIDGSYEEAARWLGKASSQGSGEASEVLAQLITRMHANGHTTTYTDVDSTRLHALARSQGFDVEPISAVCYQVKAGANRISLEPLPRFVADDPKQSFTDDELASLQQAGVSGSLHYSGAGGKPGSGDSVLLTRPQGPTAHVRIVLDHALSGNILLPIPAHRDVIYVQRGDEFLAFPSTGPNLPRFLWLDTSNNGASQVGISVQTMDGSYSGGACAAFP